jgi:DNA-binding response OmpR family regulator
MTEQSSLRVSRPGAQSGGAAAVAASLVCVLYIEDDPNDSELLRAAMQQAKVGFQLQCVEDAEMALAYLQGQGSYADRGTFPLPGLILLDLKMPRTSGFEVLKWIRKHRELEQVPVVVLSGSELKEDMQQAYAGGANSYLVKPLGFESLVHLVRNIHSVWLGHQRAA